MSRRSTVTVRSSPVGKAVAESGACLVRAETFTVETRQRLEVIDLTDRITETVHGLGVREGLVSVCVLHTTCAVFLNEFQAALVADIKQFLERAVEQHFKWTHNDPAYSDCDRVNADAHLRAMLLGQGLSLQMSGGEIVLGQWQRVLLGEMDGPRERTLRVSVMGVA